MNRFFVVLTTILVFTIGCSAPISQETEPPKPAKEQVPEVEPMPIEPPPELPSLLQIEPTTEKKPAPKPASKPAPKRDTASAFHERSGYILKTFVDDKGLVDYKKLKRERDKLKQLQNEFAGLDTKTYEAWSANDKIALWLNAYNVQMLRVLLDNYPIESTRMLRVLWPPDSIRHIQPVRKIGVAKWDDYKLIVMDEQFTLSEIQQRFFRNGFQEPRVFLAICHGSISGPPLADQPYLGERLSDQLDQQVKKFLARRDSFRIDREEKTVYLSSIFASNWFGSEFIDKFGTDKKFKDQQPAIRAVLNFITNYISPQDVTFLELQSYTVKFSNYNWRLNQQ